MLHRLAVNLKMDALLYQLSVFSVFNKILSDPAAAAYTVQKKHQAHDGVREIYLYIFDMNIGLRFGFLVTGTGHLCQVCAEPFLCTGGKEQQGIH